MSSDGHIEKAQTGYLMTLEHLDQLTPAVLDDERAVSTE